MSTPVSAEYDALTTALHALADEWESRGYAMYQSCASELRAVIASSSAPSCVHDWTERGSGPDDHWRECWLCGRQESVPTEALAIAWDAGCEAYPIGAENPYRVFPPGGSDA